MKYIVKMPNGKYLLDTPDWNTPFTDKKEEAKIYTSDKEFFHKYYPQFEMIDVESETESTPNFQFDSKNIYLKKDDQIVGLHAVGHAEPYTFTLRHLDGTEEEITTDFMEIEKWGNEYTPDYEIKGRGSFRVFDLTIEHTAKAFEEEGWVRFEREK